MKNPWTKRSLACILGLTLLMTLLLTSAIFPAAAAAVHVQGMNDLSNYDLYSSNSGTSVVSEPGWTMVSPATAGAKKAVFRNLELPEFIASYTTMLDSSGRVKNGLLFRASGFGSGQDAQSGFICLLERKVRDGVNSPVNLTLHKYGKAADGTTDKYLGRVPATVTAPETDPLNGDLYEGTELMVTAAVAGNTLTAEVKLADGTQLYALSADLTAKGASEDTLGVHYSYTTGSIGFYLTNDGGNRPNNKIKDIAVQYEGTGGESSGPDSSGTDPDPDPEQPDNTAGGKRYTSPVCGPLDLLSSYDLYAVGDGSMQQEGTRFTADTTGNKKAILRNAWYDDFTASLAMKVDENGNLKTGIAFRVQYADDGVDGLEGYQCVVQRIAGKNRIDIIFYKYGLLNGTVSYLGELGRLVQEGAGSIVGDMAAGLAGQELVLNLTVEGKQASASFGLKDQPAKASETLNVWLNMKTSKETADLSLYYEAGAVGLYMGQVNSSTPIFSEIWDFSVLAPGEVTADTTVADGALYKITASEGGCVMASNKFGLTENAWVVTQTYNRDLNQIWRAERQNDGSYRFCNLSTGRYMTLRDGAAADGTAICVADADPSAAAQSWALQETRTGSGLYRILSAVTGKAAERKEGAAGSGVQIVQGTVSDQLGQLWLFEKVSDGTGDYPVMLPLTGAQSAASCPEIIREGNTYYAYNMGGGIGIKKSNDLRHWESAGEVFSTRPSWISTEIPGGTIWAPGVYKIGNLYYCYYCVSTSGSQNSAIGVAVNETLNPAASNYAWVDKGMVIRSNKDVDDYNCIDPNIFIDGDGQPWLIFGSYWSGIKMRKIQASTGMLDMSDTTTYTLANRTERPGGIEAPYIIKRGDYYYLFAAYGNFDTKYYCGVGRSTSLTGPYVDRNGRSMMEGGHTAVTDYKDGIIKVGHDSVFRDTDGQDYLVCEYFWGGSGSMMCISTIEWTDDGWPVTALNPDVLASLGE